MFSCSDDGRSTPADKLPDTADYSSLSWSKAFEAAHTKFSREYAFTEWKGVDFRNPGESEAESAVMTAIDDDKKSLDMVNFAPTPDMEDVMKLVEYRDLDSGYGYVRVYVENDMGGESEYAWAVHAKFEEAVTYFFELSVPGRIVDLRGNMGGSDETAADLSGFFYKEARHYENQFLYNALTGTFMWVLLNEKENDILPIPRPLEITPQSGLQRPVMPPCLCYLICSIHRVAS